MSASFTLGPYRLFRLRLIPLSKGLRKIKNEDISYKSTNTLIGVFNSRPAKMTDGELHYCTAGALGSARSLSSFKTKRLASY